MGCVLSSKKNKWDEIYFLEKNFKFMINFSESQKFVNIVGNIAEKKKQKDIITLI